MIEVLTGKPGSGKSLRAVELGCQYVLEGRRVFADGIEGLDHAKTGIQPFPGAFCDWASVLKPGDVLIVDEVQRYLRVGEFKGKPPDWVEELTRNRHYGIDMLWTTQDATNLVPFVRKLINVHQYFKNKYGGPSAKVYKWIDGVHDTDSAAELRKAETWDYSYPESVFGLYKSAELHTREKKLPKKFRVLWAALAAMVVFAVLAGYVALHAVGGKPASAPVGSAGVAGAKGLPSVSPQRSAAIASRDFFARMEPRIPGVLWSAPMFDGAKPQSQPETYCIAVEQGPCVCRTEQGTSALMPDAQCRAIARNGLYNPFRRPLREGLNGGQVRQEGAVVSALDDRPVTSAAGSMAVQVPGSALLPSASAGSSGFRPLGAPYPAERFQPGGSQP